MHSAERGKLEDEVDDGNGDWGPFSSHDRHGTQWSMPVINLRQTTRDMGEG